MGTDAHEAENRPVQVEESGEQLFLSTFAGSSLSLDAPTHHDAQMSAKHTAAASGGGVGVSERHFGKCRKLKKGSEGGRNSGVIAIDRLKRGFVLEVMFTYVG